ncbi:MAG: hypothetical protein KKH01_07975 [Firmicutes bacterium]|nr:hypothetical protein [Bacillota bacterium]
MQDKNSQFWRDEYYKKEDGENVTQKIQSNNKGSKPWIGLLIVFFAFVAILLLAHYI